MNRGFCSVELTEFCATMCFFKQDIPWQKQLFLPKREKINIFRNNEALCNCFSVPLGLPSSMKVTGERRSKEISPSHLKPQILGWVFCVGSSWKFQDIALVGSYWTLASLNISSPWNACMTRIQKETLGTQTLPARTVILYKDVRKSWQHWP